MWLYSWVLGYWRTANGHPMSWGGGGGNIRKLIIYLPAITRHVVICVHVICVHVICVHILTIMCMSRYITLEGMAPYGRLLLAPSQGWWTLATWRALRALWIAVKKNWTPIFFIGPPPYTPPPAAGHLYPLHRVFFIFIIGGPPPIPPTVAPPPPLPLAQSFFLGGGDLGFYWCKKRDGGKEGTRLGFYLNYNTDSYLTFSYTCHLRRNIRFTRRWFTRVFLRKGLKKLDKIGKAYLKKPPIFGQVALTPPSPAWRSLNRFIFCPSRWVLMFHFGVLNSWCGQSSLGLRGQTSLGVSWVNSQAKVE